MAARLARQQPSGVLGKCCAAKWKCFASATSAPPPRTRSPPLRPTSKFPPRPPARAPTHSTRSWQQDGGTLTGHTDWVRDVAWAPSLGLPTSMIASAGQDGKVFIWVERGDGARGGGGGRGRGGACERAACGRGPARRRLMAPPLPPDRLPPPPA